MARILVTGGAGFIGSHLTKKLLLREHHVFCIDDFNDYYKPQFKKENIRPFLKNKNYQLFEGDIRDKHFLEAVFKKIKPQKVIHLAARAGVRPSIANPTLYFQVNLLGTVNLLELSKNLPHLQFILGSSSSVYGNSSRIPLSEEEKNLQPISPYGISKLSAEKATYLYHRLYKIPITCLRLFTVYGPWGRPDMAPYKFTDAIYQGKVIEKFGRGDTERDYTYIDDIVEGIISSTQKIFDFEIINLGNSSPCRLNQFIKIIEGVVGKKAKIKEKPKQTGDVEKTYANIKKATLLLNWKPKTSLEEGITKFFQWYLKSGRVNLN